jgi:hypothetical protein
VSTEWIPSAGDSAPVQNLKTTDGPAQEGHVDSIVDAIQSIQLAPAPRPKAPRSDGGDEFEDSCLFLASMFPAAPSSALPPPEKQCRRGGIRSTFAEISRRSTRQAAKKMAIPVSQRATSRLIRQL